MILDAHGIRVDVPRGWDARIFRRSESDVDVPGAAFGVDQVPQSGFVDPVLHMANFPLPPDRGDYGSGAVNTMGSNGVFVALLEFGPESVGSALFSARGLPRLRAGELSSRALQRPHGTLAGAQRFFVESGRAFCCYAVVGSTARRSTLAPLVNGALASVRIAPR